MSRKRQSQGAAKAATMGDFDPFTATVGEAKAQPDPRVALRLRQAARALERLRAYFTQTPLDGMAVCARAGLAAPAWLADAYLSRFDEVLNFNVRSWDEAFGAPPGRKGVNLADARHRHRLLQPVVDLFNHYVGADPSPPVDKGLWERIGAELGVSESTAEKIYREAKRMGMAMTAAEVRTLSRGSIRMKFPKPAGIRKRC